MSDVPDPAEPRPLPPLGSQSAQEREKSYEEHGAEAAERERRQLEATRRRPSEPPPTLERRVVATRRVEWLIVAALLLAALAAAGFVVVYVVSADNQLLGLALGLALAALAVAAIVAGKRLVPQETVADVYHWFGDPDAREDVAAIVAESAEGISRRRLIAAAGATAGATLGAALLIPAASLGPNVGDRLQATPWRRGRRLVKSDGEPLRADEVVEEAFLTAFAEGADPAQLPSSLVVVRVPAESLRLPADRRAGAPEGILAFSKICPHAGCAVSMYRIPKVPQQQPAPALICPCHYSTFDPGSGGALLFGPAGRDLPQLPVEIDTDGVLVAAGDFFGPVGPSSGGGRS
jgi:ubiquinol-cytochrome c reductase iron-sulfur subunit